MKYRELTDISIPEIRQKYDLSHIGDDLVLFEDLAKTPMPERPFRNRSVIVGLCLKGCFRYTADTTEYRAEPGDVIILHNGQVISGYTDDEGSVGIGIMMTYDFFHEIVKGVHELSSLFLFSRTHPVFRIADSEVQDVRKYFELIKEKVEDTSNHFRKDVVRTLISAMIYDLCDVIYRIQQSQDKRQTRAEKIFTEFIHLVEQNFRQERRVGWYGEQLCITSKYLSEIVRQASQRTPNEWINSYILTELRVQLKDTMKSIKEIAEDLHFPNQSSLGKFFKEHVGVSPSAYRKG